MYFFRQSAQNLIHIRASAIMSIIIALRVGRLRIIVRETVRRLGRRADLSWWHNWVTLMSIHFDVMARNDESRFC